MYSYISVTELLLLLLLLLLLVLLLLLLDTFYGHESTRRLA